MSSGATLTMRAKAALRATAMAAGFVMLSAGPSAAQSKASLFDSGPTPESQLLDLIDLVAEPKKQLELFDVFVKQFPRYEGMGTVYAQMQDLCVEEKLWDRALTLGDNLLAIDESDIEAVRRNLKAAEGKNDAALIAKWKERLKQLEPPEGEVSATSTVRLPFVDENPTGDLADIDFSAIPKTQKPRVEAVLFNRAVEEKDLKRRLELLNLFQRQFPNSAHSGKIAYLFFMTHRDLGDAAKALSAAEVILTRDKTREDVLFYVAQTYFASQREQAKMLQYSGMVLDILRAKPKPDFISEEDWTKQKHLLVQQSHWIMGQTYVQRGQWSEANNSLRAALAETPIAGDLHAAVLYQLGFVNYKMKNIQEALKLYRQCAALQGAYQAQATQSIASIKSEYDLQ